MGRGDARRSRSISEMIPRVLGGITFEDVVTREHERAEALYNIGLKEVARVIGMALEGGQCILCGREWARIEVDNRFAKFVYYKPACKCYPVCTTGEDRVGCGRIMYEEYHGAKVHVQKRSNKETREERPFFRCTHCGAMVPIKGWSRNA